MRLIEDIGELDELPLSIEMNITQENYLKADEIVPVSPQRGRRHYIWARFFLRSPRIYVIAACHHSPTSGGYIGHVVRSYQEGWDEANVGKAQAWYYDTARILILWECYLFQGYRGEEPAADEGLKAAWEAFEGKLLSFFPASTIYTPGWEPLYPTAAWHSFLEVMGYSPYSERAFVKEIAVVVASAGCGGVRCVF